MPEELELTSGRWDGENMVSWADSGSKGTNYYTKAHQPPT